MPLCDTQIKSLIEQGYIKSASTSLQESNVISYGVTSYGYDPKLGTKFKIMESGIVPLDPKAEIPPYAFRDFESTEPFVVPPNTFFMGYTEEWFHIPRNTLVHVTGKSTYARLGLTTYVTPLEPDWKGHVTLEFRTAERPVVIYPGEGICQFVYLNADEICSISYADRKGKYMDQKMEVTHAKVRNATDNLSGLSYEYIGDSSSMAMATDRIFGMIDSLKGKLKLFTGHSPIQKPDYDPDDYRNPFHYDYISRLPKATLRKSDDHAEDLTTLMPNAAGNHALKEACPFVDGAMEVLKRRLGTDPSKFTYQPLKLDHEEEIGGKHYFVTRDGSDSAYINTEKITYVPSESEWMKAPDDAEQIKESMAQKDLMVQIMNDDGQVPAKVVSYDYVGERDGLALEWEAMLEKHGPNGYEPKKPIDPDPNVKVMWDKRVRAMQDLVTQRLTAFENGEVPTTAPDYDPTEEACSLMSDLANKLTESKNKNNDNLDTDKVDD